MYKVNKNYDLGISIMKKGLKKNPHNIDKRQTLNLYQVKLKYIYDFDVEVAREKIRADSLKTIQIKGYDQKANAYYQEGNKDKAIEFFKKILEIDPKNQKAKANIKRLNQ